MDALVTVDVRKIPALCRRLGVEQRELAALAGCRADDVSRFFCAVAPGGLMDRLVDAVQDISARQTVPQ